MKKLAVVAVLAVFSLYMFGCAKKESGEEYQEAMSMDTLGSLTVSAQQQAPAAETKVLATQNTPTGQVKLEPLPPSGPYKPGIRQIQTALKNAGYYAGSVDGVSGKMTKKAIEEFQTANGLQADGKVGPKTWAALSKHLEQAPATKN